MKRNVASAAMTRQNVNFASVDEEATLSAPGTVAIDFSVHYVVRSLALFSSTPLSPLGS